jgi:two-component system, NtrC family, response regulator AtoC
MSRPSLEKAIETPRLLFVSRDPLFVRTMWLMGETNSWRIEIVRNVWEAMERVQSSVTPDLLLLDLPQGDADGLHILRWFRRLQPALPVILIGHPGDVHRRQEVIRLGALDYLVRPLDRRRLAMAIRNHLSGTSEVGEADMASGEIDLIGDDTLFIGISPVMRKLRAQAASLAESNVPVLILGEGGSGKETVARLIHKLSVRSGFEFTKVNCAVLPGDLLERELFGFERDSKNASAGKMELGLKGTILLDEITEMPMGVQEKLVRVLQEKRFIRPGTCDAVEVDIRVVTASTTNVIHAVSEKRFRQDLYNLLSAYTVHVPPLRERKQEIRLLSRHFMHKLAKQYGLFPRSLSPAAIEACQSYSWPGNLRELEIFVKRYLITGGTNQGLGQGRSGLDEVLRNDGFVSPRGSHRQQPFLIQSADSADSPDSLRSLVKNVKSEAESEAIAAALEKTGGNRKAAADLLKVSYRTLLYKIEQYRLRLPNNTVFPGSNVPSGNGWED